MGAILLDIVRLTVWLALLVAVFAPIERLFALRPAKLWRAQTGVDLCWYFINSLLPAALAALPLAALARGLHAIDPFGAYAAVGALPLWLRLVLAFVVNDIGAYWMHRWQHANPVLWRFHAVHHSAEHVDWLVNTRGHPVDMVLVRMAGLAPVYLLGLAPAAGEGSAAVTLWVSVLGTVWSFLIHANVRWRFGPLEQLVATPAFHHWHHTNDEHRDRNFAALFPVVDRIFGTLHLPRGYPSVYGVDARVAPTLAGQLLDPFAPVAAQKPTTSET
jgi:sterol desaturase/sphingolipid hydroxylase (fatty acid hydroxylase superfamily)